METRRRGDLSPRLYNGKLDPRNRYCGEHGKLSVTDRDPRIKGCVEYVFCVMRLHPEETPIASRQLIEVLEA
jgi:hypothetical protein